MKIIIIVILIINKLNTIFINLKKKKSKLNKTNYYILQN